MPSGSRLTLAALLLASLPNAGRGQDAACARLRASHVECDAEVPGRIHVTFQLENASELEVDRLFLLPRSPELRLFPDEYILPPVAPGTASGELSLTIELDPTTPPAAICLDLSIHESSTGQCCVEPQVCRELTSCRGGPVIKRADANLDGRGDISDAIVILGYLFLGLPATTCLETMDTDDSKVIDITDAIYFLSFLFLGGRAPPPPFPDCGIDPTDDALTCELYPHCN
jgi:hypothetical protein